MMEGKKKIRNLKEYFFMFCFALYLDDIGFIPAASLQGEVREHRDRGVIASCRVTSSIGGIRGSDWERWTVTCLGSDLLRQWSGSAWHHV